ncbi:YaiI/YqxD family protein [Vibrio cholerae]
MKIWVDADACPVVIRDVLYRASQRTGVEVTLVANQFIRTPASPKVNMLQVQQGFDVADNEIVKRCQAGDLVITSDIPLADEVITKGAQALNSRGEMYSKENIKARLNMRDFMDTMRSSGVQMGGPPPLSQADRQQFANHLDKWLVHWQRSAKAAKPE